MSKLNICLFLLCLFGMWKFGHSFDYLGCYRDDPSDLDLSAAPLESSRMTREMCVTHCKYAGFRFAAVQSYSKCWCGSSYGKHGRVDESECNTNCIGIGTQYEMCGGNSRNSILLVPHETIAATTTRPKPATTTTPEPSPEEKMCGADGTPCVFPFTYNGNTYEECTKASYHTLWCSYDATYNGRWGVCETCPEEKLCGADGTPCVFPFTYNGNTYDECTKAAYHTLWCSYDATYKGRWGVCETCPV